MQVFNVPSALAAIFLSASIRYPERKRVAASLCAFWLPLELGERIERLGLAVQRVFRLKSGEFNRGNANGTNLVLSRAAITKRNGQKANQFEHVCNIQRGELSGLSITRERLLVETRLFSSTHQLCRLQLP